MIPAFQAPEHNLYRDGDANIPASILDIYEGGQVCLDLCKRCGRAEVELDEPCLPRLRAGARLGESETVMITNQFGGVYTGWYQHLPGGGWRNQPNATPIVGNVVSWEYMARR